MEKELIEVLNCKVKSKQFFSEKSVDEIIQILKFYGIYISNNKKIKKIEDTITEYMSEKCKESLQSKDKINEYYKEIEIWNKLVEEFYQHHEFKEFKEISDNKKLFSFLIAIEFYMRSIVYKRKEGENLKEGIDFNIVKNYGDSNRNLTNMTENEFDLLIDLILRNASRLISSLLYEKSLINDRSFKYDFNINLTEKEIMESLDSLSLIDKLKVIEEELEKWKLGYTSLGQENNVFNITIKPDFIRDLKNNIVEEVRLENERCTTLLRKQNQNKKFLMNSKEIAFINQEEEYSHEAIKLALRINDLSYKIWDVEIVEWLRAYVVIKEINKKRLGDSYLPNGYVLNDWLYISTLDEWKNELIKFKISKKSAEIIVDKLIFKKDNIDIFDTPFLSIDNKIITLPYQTSIIDIATCFVSLCRSESANLIFKGDTFEAILLEKLNNIGIPAKAIKYNSNNEDYQCDLAFILNNDLFLCECKNRFQSNTLKKRYRFYNQMLEEDKNQINRIADFYSKNLQIVRKNFDEKISSHWKPKRIYKVLIYSAKVQNSVDTINNLIITDFSIFDSMISKRYPSITNGDYQLLIQHKELDKIYSGSLTLNKLSKFIKEPYQVKIVEESLRECEQEITIEYSKLKRKYLYSEMDHYYYS